MSLEQKQKTAIVENAKALEGQGKIHRLFGMNPEEKSILRKRIEAKDGNVQIFIHPDFEHYSGLEHNKKDANELAKLKWAEQVFQKIISSESGEVLPIICFLDAEDVRGFIKKENRLKEITRQQIYVIRTEAANPAPLGTKLEEKYSSLAHSYFRGGITDDEREETWREAISILKDLGVKNILLAGLEMYKSPQGEMEEHRGCVGVAAAKLKNDFKIRLSTVTWPDK